MASTPFIRTAAGTVLIALLCNILWGSAFPFVKTGYALFGIASDTMSIILFAGIRFALAGLFVLLVTGIRQKHIPRLSNWKGTLILAMVQTVLQYIFFYIGLSHTSGSNGSIVNSTSTFFAVILSHFAYKDDKINVKKAVGSILGFLGVLAVTMQEGTLRLSLKGEGLIILAAFVFACSSLINKQITKTDAPDCVTGYSLLLGGAVLTAVGLIGGGRITQVCAGGIGVLFYLAFLSAAAFTLWSALLKNNPVGRISIYNFVIPVSGTLLSSLMLGENILHPRYLISLLLVCIGIMIVNKK